MNDDLSEGADLPPILTANQVGEFFNVDCSTARRWFRQGFIPGFRIGSRWYASRKAIYEFIERGGGPCERAP